MPDWHELVRQRLSSLALDAEEKDEVQVELAAHLEESYEAFCKEGLPEKEAVHRSFEQVADWRDLQRRIFFAGRGFAANRASRQRLSRARAYWGVSLDVSDRLAHRTNHRKASRF